MNIALTVGAFNQLGGIERVTVELALGYRALGHAVTILASEWDPAYEDRFEFVRLPAPARPAWWRTLRLPYAASAVLRGRKFDFVHGQGTSTLDCDLLTFHSVHAAWVALSIKQSGPLSPRGLLKRVYPFHRATLAIEERQIRRHRGLFHACSPEVREELLRHYGVAPERVRSVPWGIDLETFRPDPARRAEVRQAWGIAEDTPVLLLAANEFNRKGLATLLNALARLDRPDVQLWVAGRDDPRPYREQVRALGLEAQVRFLGHGEMPPVYQASDVLVLPTSYEPWGLVIGEALASGLPVVTSRLAGAHAMIRHGENGLLLEDPRDADVLARALEIVLVTETRRRLASEARTSALRWGWEGVCRELLTLGYASRR